MKKTLAAILGLAMMTSTAFAANPTIGSGDPIDPGSKIDIPITEFVTSDGTPLTGDTSLTTADFAISTKKITKGANLIKEIKIDDDDEVVRIVLNDDMTLSKPRSANLVIETLSLKAKRENGDVNRNNVVTVEDIRETIGYAESDIDISNGSGTLEDGMNKIEAGSQGYGEVSYSVGELMLDGRAYDGDKIFVKGTQEANSTVLKNYPDADLRFVGVNTTGMAGSFNVMLAAEEDEFVYKVSNGKLVSSGLKWSEDDYSWKGRLTGSTTYVISDIRLSTASVDDDDTTAGDGTEDDNIATNPDTGANDVVGVAAALAVVSLIAAGALTLRKNK